MLSYFNLNQVTQPPADLLQPFFPTQRTKRIHSFQKSGAHSFDVALMAMASEESRDLGGEDGRRRGTQESGKRRQLNETEETAMAQKNRKPIKYEGSKKEEEEDDEEFWTSVSALRNTKYGIAMWCTAWNGAGLWLLACTRWDQLVFGVALGLGHLLSGWQAKRIAKQRSFRSLLSLLPPTLLFIQLAVLVLLNSLANVFNSFKLTMNGDLHMDFQFDGRLESIFAIGNTVLMTFVCYCNLIVLRIICVKVGAQLDAKNLRAGKGMCKEQLAV